MMNFKFANWPAPKHITALSTTRGSGVSQAPYASNNLALHVGDNPSSVQENRSQLREILKLSYEPIWLNQTHSTHCIIAEETTNRDADAAITRSVQCPLVIMSADCLPITLCAINGEEIAAIHAGWRGLFQGVVENTLSKMHNKASTVMAWLGPANCGNCYEVGEEVYLSFTNKYPESQLAFKPNQDKWFADLAKIAEIILKQLGVISVHKSNLCTFELQDDFYSYRRQSQTGRIATLIWFNQQKDS